MFMVQYLVLVFLINGYYVVLDCFSGLCLQFLVLNLRHMGLLLV